MGIRIISVLCEGSHDVAFLSKLIRAQGFKLCEGTKLKDFPSPMDKILTTEATKANVEELKLSEIHHALLPSGVLKNEDESSFFFMYALGGDSRRDRRDRILTTLMDSVPRTGELTELIGDTEIYIAYFLDSDEKGVAKRLNELSSEIRSTLGADEISLDSNGQVISYDGLQIGAYIFRSEEDDKGKLEDIMLPLMKVGNDKIFEDAEIYIGAHYDSARDKKKKFKKDKATIGIAGQLQRSGASNNVIISHSDYISADKIKSCTKCQEIISFFKLLSETEDKLGK